MMEAATRSEGLETVLENLLMRSRSNESARRDVCLSNRTDPRDEEFMILHETRLSYYMQSYAMRSN